MASIHGFNSWSEIADYIDNTLGINYTDSPTDWIDAMKTEMQGSKFVKIVDEITGMETEQIVPDSLYEGVGEFHVGNNYQGQTISGGGAKSAPTAKSVITQNSSSGGTAVITEDAIGVKDTGVVGKAPVMNILSGIMQVYGLIHTGITVANAQVWKDMSNYVYDTDFTEDTPLERVLEFMGKRITTYITDRWDAIYGDTPYVSIPESIAQKMYEFMSNHMIQQQTPGIDPSLASINTAYGEWVHRSYELRDPSTRTLEKYSSAVSNPSRTVGLRFTDLGDDLVKYAVADAMEQAIASGFEIAASVATAVMAATEGIWSYLKEQSVDAVDDAIYANISVEIDRGQYPPPKTTPVSLSEIKVYVNAYRDDCIEIATPILDPNEYINAHENLYLGGTSNGFPQLTSAYSYDYGDCVRYLKRGHTGEESSDYAFAVALEQETWTTQTRSLWSAVMGFYANERTLSYVYTPNGYSTLAYLNGFAIGKVSNRSDGTDTYITVPDDYFVRRYSNIGLVGTVASYMPDDYLVTAGIRSRTDVNGVPDQHPEPGKTKEEVYSSMNKKKQNARPQAEVDPETGETVVNNYITNYVPSSIPMGNTDILINNGMNNPDNPNTYVDNRPQNVIADGYINSNDPVEGFNDDVDEAVKDFNDSRNDPNHYPDTIPANEPNPQYPTNPPTDPSGESDDPTDPSTMVGVTASGMVSVYNPTKAEVISFSSWLWTGNVFENIKKLLQDPMEAIIGMHVMYATPHTTTPSNIIVGWLDSGVAAKVVDKQYTQLDCGDVFVPEYYGDVLDYEPYVHVHMYLPFVGIVSLKPNDVIGKLVNVTYGIDALTGTCLAMITTTKGDSKIQCYTFPGNCAVQIPLTGGSYASVIRGISSMAVGVAGSVATGNVLGAVGGAVAGVMASHLDVSHSGTLGANAGAMGVKKPYIIITRKIAYDAAGYNQFYGYPANKTVVLGTCKGYTRVKSVHIESIPIATSDEKQEIETLLKQGVIIR